MNLKIDNPPDFIARLAAGEGPLGPLVSLTLSAPKKGELPHGERVRIRALPASDSAFQKETIRDNKAFQQNLSTPELSNFVVAVFPSLFKRAEAQCAQGTISFLSNRKGSLTALIREEATCRQASAHNREKKYLLSEDDPVPFLVDLGVMTAEGHLIKAMTPKFRQINRYLEFIDDIIDEVVAGLDENRVLEVVDFGCGKSYLTFATHHFLTKVRGIPARVTGLDLKKDVIDHCQALVQRYGSSGLRFLTGDIEHYSCNSPPDVVISLHACDTATDAALAKAVSWGSKAIFAVPCCQHELNARLAEKDTSSPAEQELAYALKHGLVRERIAALLTDASRAAVLEQYGYRVQLLEFIDMSHTPKNILIRAIKKTQTHSIPTRACRPFGRELSLERLLGGDKE